MSRIKSVTVGNSFDTNFGPLFPCDVELEDGRTGYASSKTSPPWYSDPGTEVVVTENGQTKNGVVKFKIGKPEHAGSSGGGGAPSKSGGGGYSARSPFEGCVATSCGIVKSLIEAGHYSQSDGDPKKEIQLDLLDYAKTAKRVLEVLSGTPAKAAPAPQPAPQPAPPPPQPAPQPAPASQDEPPEDDGDIPF